MKKIKGKVDGMQYEDMPLYPKVKNRKDRLTTQPVMIAKSLPKLERVKRPSLLRLYMAYLVEVIAA